MYAVVNTGGKQYKVREGEIFRTEKLPGNVGDPVTFDKILLFSDGENLQIGQPLLDDVEVQGHIVEQDKARKIIVFKYKRRKRYRRKQGHRQPYTAIKIDKIGHPGALAVKEIVETVESAAEPVMETSQTTEEPQVMEEQTHGA